MAAPHLRRIYARQNPSATARHEDGSPPSADAEPEAEGSSIVELGSTWSEKLPVPLLPRLGTESAHGSQHAASMQQLRSGFGAAEPAHRRSESSSPTDEAAAAMHASWLVRMNLKCLADRASSVSAMLESMLEFHKACNEHTSGAKTQAMLA